jgi:hypothetical protein
MTSRQKTGPWSYKEQRQLAEFSARSDDPLKLAKRLKRPPASIVKKAKELGLKAKAKS